MWTDVKQNIFCAQIGDPKKLFGFLDTQKSLILFVKNPDYFGQKIRFWNRVPRQQENEFFSSSYA